MLKRIACWADRSPSITTSEVAHIRSHSLAWLMKSLAKPLDLASSSLTLLSAVNFSFSLFNEDRTETYLFRTISSPFLISRETVCAMYLSLSIALLFIVISLLSLKNSRLIPVATWKSVFNVRVTSTPMFPFISLLTSSQNFSP